VYGLRRGNASIRASLVAVLVGAVLAGGATLAGRVPGSPTPAPIAEAAAIEPSTVVTTPPTSVVTPAAPTSTTHPTTTTSTPPPSPARQVFALVNQARARAGCKALADDPRLDTAAQQHSDDMAGRHYFAHTTPDGVTFDKREEAAGYSNPGGENIAQGQTGAQQVMTAWMNSAGHRANILNCDFAAIGIGLNTHGWYWTQDFGR